MIDFTSPLFWSFNLTLVLFAMIFGMMFGKSEGHSQNKTWAYRNAGGEIAFVFFPFILYSIAHGLNGSILDFLTTPELPMAAMIVSGIAMFSLVKGAVASKGKFAPEAFVILMVAFLAIFMSCGGLVFWLTLKESVSPWFSVGNFLVVIFAVGFSFAVSASMAHLVRNPEEVGIEP
ncbi:hypothetical protein [Marinobacter alexandrii]|uniref:hypothetical protein n=1 Tax=Marinobacter alexandrii TaxID=2570351 RepID=UPI0032643D4E